ncbi:MAG: alpha/beta hydrolase [Cyclobacteriaceae bacterium]|nr:alpha/beta hydrolase [Cyclobacteriaceae bacterium]
MQEHELAFNFKARYYQLGQIDSKTKQVWFVLHGYGQLAKFFLPKFEILLNHEICLIAPEGLSRFYLEDVTSRAVSGNQRVGATWMTAENRLMDITNYLNYLQQVYLSVRDKFASLPITLLGFSQGAATASRWAINNPQNFDRLILWAGIFPTDMDFTKANEVLSNKNVMLVYGTNDPFLSEKRMKEMTDLTRKLGFEVPAITFGGGHELDEATLLKFV